MPSLGAAAPPLAIGRDAVAALKGPEKGDKPLQASWDWRHIVHKSVGKGLMPVVEGSVPVTSWLARSSSPAF